MANVTETSIWESGIYQLETTDPVEGGASGISNTQASQLGNRTKWLFDQIIALFRFAPKRVGYITGVNLPVTSGSVSFSGDISAANGSANGILITLNTAMPSMNYKVKIDVESLGSYGNDGTVKCPEFKKVSTSQFYFIMHETDNLAQNLKIHFDVISLD